MIDVESDWKCKKKRKKIIFCYESKRQYDVDEI